MLQGGGALGAYHIGAYEALAEAGLHPDWVAGISIGAINAAVIAGNPPEDRVAKLQGLWEAISWPDLLGAWAFGSGVLHNWASNWEALMFGQPNFFAPRLLNPLLLSAAPPAQVSFYDTGPMLATLAQFADFPTINRGTTRLSLGATNVETGQLKFFDSQEIELGPHHVLASGSLPPGFPATPIGESLYWDGGCVSNTPLDVLLDEPDYPHTVVFMVDLWSASGKPPTNMGDVTWRAKQIQYASRTAHHIDAVATKINLRHAVRVARHAGAPEVAAVPDSELLHTGRLDIVHVTYHPADDQIPNSDAEFSRSSIADRRAAGYRDLKAAIEAQPWMRVERPAHLAAMVHKVERGALASLAEPNLTSTTDATAPILEPAA